MVIPNDPNIQIKTTAQREIDSPPQNPVPKQIQNVKGDPTKTDFKTLLDSKKKQKERAPKTKSTVSTSSSHTTVEDLAALTRKPKKEDLPDEDDDEGDDGESSDFDMEQERKKSGVVGSDSPVVHVRPSSSNLDSMAAQEVTPTVAAPGSSQSELVAKIKEYVDLIVNKIYTVKLDGKTDTVVTFNQQNDNLLAGAKLTISSYDTATGQFNLTFSELSPTAKRILDMQQTQNSLMLALEKKGYMLHILVVTTEKEDNNLPIQPQADQQFQKGDDQGAQEGRQGKNKKG